MSSYLYNHRDADTILEEIISMFSILQPDVNINEASTMYFLFQTFAYISAQNNDIALQFANAAFIATAQDEDLTDLAADRGVVRKDAVKAIAVLSFDRAVLGDTITIPASSSFATDTSDDETYITFKTLDVLTMPATSLSVTGYAQAQTGGAIGNTAIDTITNFIDTIDGIDTVTNPVAGAGGVDEESDSELRDRVIDVLQNNTGRVTVSGYRQFIESLSGVRSATVFAATGAMPNYITAVVTTSLEDDGIPTASQLAVWEASVNDDENRAVVDVIDVVAPVSIEITVNATISEYAAGAGEDATKARVKASVISYINALEPGTAVRVVDIENVVHDDTGVFDFTLATPTTNQTLTTLQKATASTTSVTIN